VGDADDKCAGPCGSIACPPPCLGPLFYPRRTCAIRREALQVKPVVMCRGESIRGRCALR
jgi:hypothetical protein